MKCANCGVRKFFFTDGEELIPGSDIQFCGACRKKVTPFLEEKNTYPTHAQHLEARKEALGETGVTSSGMSALTAYCAYMDRITPKPIVEEEETPPQKPTPPAIAQVVLVKDVVAKIEAQETKIVELTKQVDTMGNRLRVAIWVAVSGGAASLCSFVALLVMLLGG